MRLAYWHSSSGNFGDEMNTWFWDRELPGWQGWKDDKTFLFGIGSILNQDSLSRDGHCVIVGSGFGYTTVGVATDYPRCDFRFVRGPLTARRLGLPTETGISDPAILAYDALPSAPRQHGNVLFVPHHATASLNLPWERWCQSLDVEYLSPCGDDSMAIIERIAGARLVVAESLHAAIIADTFRIPWITVRLSGGFNEFKWRDWTQSLELDFTCVRPGGNLPLMAKRLRSWLSGQHGSEAEPRKGGKSAGAGGERKNAAASGSKQMPTALARFAGPLGIGFKAALWLALRHPPTLSADTVIQDRRRRIRLALEQTAEVYGERGVTATQPPAPPSCPHEHSAQAAS